MTSNMRAVLALTASVQRCLVADSYLLPVAARSITSQAVPANEVRNLDASTSGRTAADIIAKHNMSLPHLKDQVVLAKVISASKGSVLVDPGYFGFCTFRKAALSIDQIHNPGQDLLDRTGKNDVRPGDVLKFRLSDLFSPYGEMHLEPLKTRGDAQSKMVWEELRDAMTHKRKVKGRVLNACQGGYAVGIAGYVGLLTFNRSKVEVTRKIGVLQDFYICDMDEGRKLVYVDCRSRGDGPAQSEGNLYSNIGAMPNQPMES